jgi:formylglycine-generating enzyme required for sulfatase activity
MIRKEDDMVMVCVPAGEFTMGNEERLVFDDQISEHVVALDTFWIDQTEVTNAQFTNFLNDIRTEVIIERNEELQIDELEYQGNVIYGLTCADCTDWEDRINWDDNDKRFTTVSGYERHPVALVSWYGARDYCASVGALLPTEAEWEKAARGTDKRLFPWGGDFDASKLNSFVYEGADTFKATAPVGSFPEGVSPYGALDMSGNVWEWTRSLYKEYPYDNSDGDEDEKTNGSDTRVVRGGSWSEGEESVTTTWRSHFTRDTCFSDTGFRCVRSVEQMK